MSKKVHRPDEIGYWSEVKLDIVRKYASAYSVIMAKQPLIKRHIYVDAFAGAGRCVSKTTGDFVPGTSADSDAEQQGRRGLLPLLCVSE